MGDESQAWVKVSGARSQWVTEEPLPVRFCNGVLQYSQTIWDDLHPRPRHEWVDVPHVTSDEAD